MRVTFLGTGTSGGVPVPTCDCAVCTSRDPRDRRLRPSVWIEWPGASVLIDTASDLREQALRHRIRRVDAVLYTHAHADHVLGLDDLRVYNWRQRGPVPAYGSTPTLDRLGRTFWYAFEGNHDADTFAPAVDRHEIDGPFDVLGQRVVPVPLLHGSLPILGYRIGRFAYLTDVSRIPEESYRVLDGLEVLVLNALRRRPHPTHLTLDEAVTEARRIGAARTWFTHISHELMHAPTCEALPSGIELAWDGLTIELDDPEPS